MLKWRNTTSSYGLVAIILHWLVAIGVISLFIFGLWMVELNYYDSWYRRAPELHKSIGVSLFFIMLLRVVWRLVNQKPQPISGNSKSEQRLANIVHVLLYCLIFIVMLSGYLISTADGRPIEVFGVIVIPATLTRIEQQEDIAGAIHLFLAVTLISLSGLHVLAALKHHFINKDRTLLRIFGH